MRYVLFLAIISGLISCEKKKIKEKREPWIISEKWNSYLRATNLRDTLEDGTPLPPPPPRVKWAYGNQNFIIDDSLNLYYYQLNPQFVEKCIWNEDDTIPYFQNLRTDLLIQLPEKSIADFIKLNFKKGIRDKVKIASQRDTLNSQVYFDLIKALDKNLDFSGDSDIYAIFSTTQEEDTILHYKKHKKDYDPDSIKWDKKRIRFLRK